MRDASIAANYAETLLELANRANQPEEWGRMFADVADAADRDPTLKRFLQSPQVSGARKGAILAKAFQDRLPRLLVRFLQTVIHHRRQMLLGEISREYTSRLDALQGRVHADVTVARPLDAKAQSSLAERLTKTIGEGKRVMPVFRVFPPIMGGVIVRIGDTVADGSVRTRLSRLRRRLAAAQ